MKTVLHAVRRGSADRPPLVLLHGFMGCALSWQPLFDRLEEFFQVVAFDLPGHGRSRFESFPSTVRLSDLHDTARLILNDLAAIGAERFFLYGYSMGGRVAQHMALDAPARVRKLVLESAGFGLADPRERISRRMKDQRLLADIRSCEDFEHFLCGWHRLPLFATLQGTPLMENLIRAKRANDPRELERALGIMSAGNQACVFPGLARSGVPILYLYGEKDARYSSVAGNAAAAVPGLQLAPFPEASHNIHAQFPQAVIATILPFLRQGSESGK